MEAVVLVVSTPVPDGLINGPASSSSTRPRNGCPDGVGGVMVEDEEVGGTGADEDNDDDDEEEDDAWDPGMTAAISISIPIP
jgi:hypothetical protein